MKLLISDLDGTLLNEDNTVPRFFNSFLRMLKEAGIVFSVATSRSPQNVYNLFHNIVDELYAFCSDGAITIRIKDGVLDVLSEHYLDAEEVEEVISYDCFSTSSTKMFFTGSANNFNIYIKNDALLSEEYFEKLFPFRPWMELNIESDRKEFDFRALSLLTKTSNKHEVVYRCSSKIRCLSYEETRFPLMELTWFDFLPKRISKGFAIQDFIKSNPYYGSIITLGNGKNDIELFQLSDFSYCPINSDENLVSICTRQIDSTCGEEFLKNVLKYIN